MKPEQIRFRPLQIRDTAMAPTSAITYSKKSFATASKLRKPMVEKMRRDRINNCIEKLKSFLGPELLNQQPDSKLEKADVLEMTVCFLKQRQHSPVNTSSCSSAQSEGYSRCIQEIVTFLSRDEVKTQSQRKLLTHFQNLPESSSRKSQKDQPQLHFTTLFTTSKEKIPVNGALWRPW